MTPETPDWSPFVLAAAGTRGDTPRGIGSLEGVGDRLRTAAFAEIQAREAFDWAARRFTDAPAALRAAWQGLALAEDRHLGWLLRRMEELQISVPERRVSDQLWVSLASCQSAREFAHFIASAEERGRVAGEKFRDALIVQDPVTATIFGRIAEEEVEHIALAARYYPREGDRWDRPTAHP